MELGEVRRITLSGFAVIGKEGTGSVQSGTSWIPQLWQLVTKDFTELAMLLDEKKLPHLDLWGLMSDAEKWLNPWQKTGRYLAGIQVPVDFEVPQNWQKWVLPSMEYLVVKTDEANLEMMTEKMFEEVFLQEKVQLVAAIQEHYLPSFEQGEVELYFPIKSL